MATWPSYAKILGEGFGFEPEPAVARSEMESGPPKQLLERASAMVARPVTVWLPHERLADWQAWFRDDLRRGTDWFAFTDPVDDAVRQGRIVGGAYKAAGVPGRPGWRLSMTIETWDTDA